MIMSWLLSSSLMAVSGEIAFRLFEWAARESSVMSNVLLLCLIIVDFLRPFPFLSAVIVPSRIYGCVTLTRLIVMLPRLGIDRPLPELLWKDLLVSLPDYCWPMVGSTKD